LIPNFYRADAFVVEPNLKGLNRAFHFNYFALATLFRITYGRQCDRVVSEFSAIPNIKLHVKAINLPQSCCADFYFFYSMTTGAVAFGDVFVVVETYRV